MNPLATHVVSSDLLDTFRTYLPEGGLLYVQDTNPRRDGLPWLQWYCAHNGRILHLTGMIANLMQQCGCTARLHPRRGLVGFDYYSFEIVELVSRACYGRPDALTCLHL